jgi:cytochrome c-type biogenesis protein CcmE
MERKRATIFVVFAAVVGLIGWLFISGFDDTMVYYMTVSELKAQNANAETRGLRVSGNVVPGSVVRSEDGLQMRFTLDELGQFHILVNEQDEQAAREVLEEGSEATEE